MSPKPPEFAKSFDGNNTTNLMKQHLSVNQPEKVISHCCFKEILKQFAEAFLFIDTGGKIVLANDAAMRMFSLPWDSTFERSFWDLFSDDYFGFSMRESLKFGISRRLIYKTHRLLELEITATFSSLGAHFGYGLSLISRDITEKQKLQTIIHRHNHMKDLGEMTASVAHEIRNSIGGIRGFASLLIRDLETNPHLQEMALAIIEGTKGLEHLVTGILHFARPIQIVPYSNDIGHFLKELTKFVKVDPAFPNTVKFTLHIPNDPILVPIDPDAMKLALLNLIFNAIQAMPQGGMLSLSLLKLEGCCHIAVSDSGIGIAPEMLDHLFFPFFTTKTKGNGLGLVETKKIIQAHKGSIDVRSQLGRGTTFTITLPLKR